MTQRPESNSHGPDTDEGPLRPHVYDGIQEYNKRLPNWWLFTFYGAIAFSVGYWACYEWWKALPDQAEVVTREMARIEGVKLAAVSNLSDSALWQMSANANFVSSGKATFLANCAQCHKADLTGGIGPNLIDSTWVHGSNPLNIYNTVTKGVPAKGMPTWGPVLGTKKTLEVTAFVLSHQKKPQ